MSTESHTPKTAAELRTRANFAEAIEGTDFTDALVLPAESMGELSKEHYQRIITYLQDNDAESIRGMSRVLEMDHGNLSRYLNNLEEYNVIEFEKSGRANVPVLKHEHVVFEPLY